MEGAGVEAGHRREAYRRQDAVGVHVPDPLVHVETAGAQFGVGAGVEAPLFLRPADGRRHAERRGGLLSLEHPLVHAAFVADHLRHLADPLGGDVVLVHVRRLDHVVVDAHEDHLVHAHGGIPSSDN
jgi:hypothetical protein